MACDRFASEIRDHALGAPLRAAAAAHLAVCSDCQAMISREEQVLGTIDLAIADVGSAQPMPDFVARVRDHIETAPRWTPNRWWMPAAVMAGIALVAAIVFGRLPRVLDTERQESAVHEIEHRPVADLNRHTSAPANPRPETKLRPRVRRQRATNVSALISDPEVLVPARQREVVDRLFDSLRAGRPEVVSMLLGLQGSERRTDSGDLAVAPLRIEPVVITALPSAAIFDK
jgi:hypothetical protein